MPVLSSRGATTCLRPPSDLRGAARPENTLGSLAREGDCGAAGAEPQKMEGGASASTSQSSARTETSIIPCGSRGSLGQLPHAKRPRSLLFPCLLLYPSSARVLLLPRCGKGRPALRPKRGLHMLSSMSITSDTATFCSSNPSLPGPCGKRRQV